jgi:3-oxoacyl-[acyl-carrier protein] reductase
MRLKDKVAIITGAGSGYGRGIATMFAQEGAKIVIADVNLDAGNETAAGIKKNGHEAVAVKADVSKAEDAAKIAETTIDKYGRIDILINNAGISRMCPVTDLTEEEWDKHLNINLKGTWLISKHVIPHMVKGGGGSIVNIASLAGVKARPLVAAYSASKGGVIMLTKQMAIELAPHKIRCNCISPVIGETPMGMGLIKQASAIYKIDDLNIMKESVLQGIPLKRGSTPSDIAYAAIYLASDESSLVTATNLTVDGGVSA